MKQQVSDFPVATPFVEVAERAVELGSVPQICRESGAVILHPFVRPGNWRIGVVVKSQRKAAA